MYLGTTLARDSRNQLKSIRYVRPEFLEPLLVDVELHAEDEVGVLDHGVGDEEGHGGQRGQPVHLSDGDEDESDPRDDEQRVRWDLVRSALKLDGIYFMLWKSIDLPSSKNRLEEPL